MPAGAVTIGEDDILGSECQRHCPVYLGRLKMKSKRKDVPHSPGINRKAIILVVDGGSSDCNMIAVTDIKTICVMTETSFIAIPIVNSDSGNSKARGA